MEQFTLFIPVFLTLLILIVPTGIRYYYTLTITLIWVLLSTWNALPVFADPAGAGRSVMLTGYFGSLTLTMDGLSAFFILVTNFTMLTGMIYSKGYLTSYTDTKSPARLSLHSFSYVALHVSMLAVLTLRDGIPFLVAWELMAVSSFMLILFEAEDRSNLKSAVNYLIQMHIGFILLVVAFLITGDSNGMMGFDALEPYFLHHSDNRIFFLFFAGFAIKAGFVPFHTWLPKAHPAAPSHVSGVMSGVMIKMGIYGIVRVVTCLHHDLYPIGLTIMILSMVTGLWGILQAIRQTDLKRALACSTIENVGIIGLGIGLGTIGLGLQNPAITLLGLGGALLHVLNHSLFKSLLFFGAGSVYKATHTRNIEALGGLIHKLPRTGGLFLFGSVAICALPPLNGFISEILIFYGLFTGLNSLGVAHTILMLLAIVTLALIGGLALFAFSRLFGVTFLGTARRGIVADERAVTSGMIFSKLLIAGAILLIGLSPMLFITPLLAMTARFTGFDATQITGSLNTALTGVTMAGLLLLAFIALLLFVRSRVVRGSRVETGPTWGCGYTAGSPNEQYTGTSFADSILSLGRPLMNPSDEYKPVGEEELFPAKRSFLRRPADLINEATDKITGWSTWGLKKIAMLQTGNIQHYILYAFTFILAIFILMFLNIL